METKLKSKEKFKGKIFSVTVDDAMVSKTGTVAKREIVHHHGGVGILAMNNHQVLLVKQYRYAIQQETLEIPAGKLELGEDPQTCALREIEEETGYRALDVSHLVSVYATPGYCTEKLHIYYTNHVEKIKNPHPGDEDEDVTYGWYHLDDCIQMISEGKINDAKTVIALLRIYQIKTVT